MWFHFKFDFLILGWAPTRRLRDVIWGLNSLFTDLLNFDDPLNIAAAEHYQRDKDAFRLKTKQWVVKYAKRWNSKWKNPENYPETLKYQAFYPVMNNTCVFVICIQWVDS